MEENKVTEDKSVKEEIVVEELKDKKAKKEKKPKKEKVPLSKDRKKKIIKRSIIGGIAGILVLYLVFSMFFAGEAAAYAYTTTVSKGDVEQTISTSGKIKTENSKVYFAPVGAEIGTVNVAVGDAVAAGDVLVAYDETSLEDAKKVAELKLQATDGSYSNSIQNNGESWGDLQEASTNLEVLDQQIADTETYITNLENKIEKKKADISKQGSLLQISLIDWEDQPDSEEYQNLRKLIQENAVAAQTDKEIQSWNNELDAYNKMLSDYKEYRSEMKSQKTTADNSTLTSGAKEELEAKTESEKIQSTATIEDIEAVESGITADFNGVVSSVDIVEGATATAGAQLLKLESTDDVVVEISVTKYDLEKIALGQKAIVKINNKEYEGEVSKINKIAETNASGAPVVATQVKISNPDSDIILGVEAKVIVSTAEKKDVIMVPYGVVNTDTTGDFAYVVENGVVVRRDVVTGISSDTDIEIVEGLNEGDQVITEISAAIVEGAAVVAIPQE